MHILYEFGEDTSYRNKVIDFLSTDEQTKVISISVLRGLKDIQAVRKLNF